MIHRHRSTIRTLAAAGLASALAAGTAASAETGPLIWAAQTPQAYVEPTPGEAHSVGRDPTPALVWAARMPDAYAESPEGARRPTPSPADGGNPYSSARM